MAEIALLATIGTSLASVILKDVARRALDAASETSTAAGLKSVIFGDLEDDLRRLEGELSRLGSVLSISQRIDPVQPVNNNLVLIWLKGVKEAAWFADNLLDEIAYEKIRIKLIPGSDANFRLTFRWRIFGRLRKFRSLTHDIHREAKTTLKQAKLAGGGSIATSHPPPATISEKVRDIRESPDTSKFRGRKADVELMVTKLCSEDNDLELSVIALVGRSGVGKTTLARMVYDNHDVCKHFGKRTWIFVSDHFKLERFLNEMLQSVNGSHNLTNKPAMEDKLQESMNGEKGFLLVLDDVWNTDEQLWKSVETSLCRIFRTGDNSKY